MKNLISNFLYFPINLFSGLYFSNNIFKYFQSSNNIQNIYGDPNKFLFSSEYHSLYLHPITKIMTKNKILHVISWNETSINEYFFDPFIIRTNLSGHTIKYNIIDHEITDIYNFKLEKNDFISASTPPINSRSFYFTFYNEFIISNISNFHFLKNQVNVKNHFYCSKIKYFYDDGPIILVLQFLKGGFVYYKFFCSSSALESTHLIQSIYLKNIPNEHKIIDFAIFNTDKIFFLFNDNDLGLYRISNKTINIFKLLNQYNHIFIFDQKIFLFDSKKWDVFTIDYFS